MKDNTSPEEKLLKLIKEDKKAKPVSDISASTFHSGQAEADRDKSVRADNFGNKIPSVKITENTKNIPFFSYFVRKYLTILSLRNIIILLISLSAFYLVFSLISPWIYLRKIKLPDLPTLTSPDTKASMEQVKTGQSGQQQQEETVKPLDFYVEKIKNRQMFTSISSEQVKSSSASVAQGEILKNISLVGVITGDSPQAIIEDKKAQKTYYVTEGQFIDEYQIEDIQEGKIILNYNGQKYELHM